MKAIAWFSGVHIQVWYPVDESGPARWVKTPGTNGFVTRVDFT